jgi:hypothetical protein
MSIWCAWAQPVRHRRCTLLQWGPAVLAALMAGTWIDALDGAPEQHVAQQSVSHMPPC